MQVKGIAEDSKRVSALLSTCLRLVIWSL